MSDITKQRAHLIVEVEGYDGESGSIVVTNSRAEAPTSLGVSDRIFCIAQIGSDGVARFDDWGYATAEEAREALRGTARAGGGG